ncbi:MAG TPA: hypothetical protein VE944_26810 [Nostoc sp.]|uniref:hypothetical protein n=1 Tax=Nostoc sp. TaxID=1180 RepID=UPI002D56032B|nr:hypothetical protein [Nostoc sp.]HYX17906.1 hypothetical protein [Nostoc sp.]
MTIKNSDIFYLENLTETDEEAILGGVLVSAPGKNGIDPDGNPSTPPGNSGVTLPTEINRLNPQGKARGFASTQSPGIVKNGRQFEFDGTTFRPV